MNPISSPKKGRNNPFPDVFGSNSSDDELENNKSTKKSHTEKPDVNHKDQEGNQPQTSKPNEEVKPLQSQTDQNKKITFPGAQISEPAKTGNLFSGISSQTTTGGLFGGINKETPKTEGTKQAEQPASGLFGQTQNKPTPGLFTGQKIEPPKAEGAQQTEQPKPNALFGQPPTKPAAGGLFGAQNQTESPKPLFTPSLSQTSSGSLFGGPKAEPSKTGGLFGAQQGEAAKPGPLLGQNQSQATTGPLFGGPKAELPKVEGVQQTEQNKPASLLPQSLLGTQKQTEQPKVEPPKTGGLFGQQSLTGGFLGAPKTEPPKTEGAQQTEQNKPASLFPQSQLGQFGTQKQTEQPKAEPPKTGGLFGQTQQSSTGGLFGQPKAEPPKTGGGLFGQTQQPPSGGLLGAPKTEPPKTEGAQQTEQNKPASLFPQSQLGQLGAQKQTEQPKAEPPKTGGLFGQIQQTSTGGFLGAPKTEPPKTEGAQQTEQNKPASLFPQSQLGQFGTQKQTEQPKAEPPKTGGLFGQTQQTSTGGLFGQPKAEPPKAGGLFGQTQQPSTGGLLGAPKTDPSKTEGAQQTEQNKPASLFPQSQLGQFGTQKQTEQPKVEPPKTGGLFGQTQQSSTGGLFGQPKAEQPKTESSSLFAVPTLNKQSSGIKTESTGSGLFGNNKATTPEAKAPSGLNVSFGQTAQSNLQSNTASKSPLSGIVKSDKPGEGPKFGISGSGSGSSTSPSQPKPSLFPGANPSGGSQLFGQPSSMPQNFTGFTNLLGQTKATFLDQPPSQQKNNLFSGVFNASNPAPTAKPLFGASQGPSASAKPTEPKGAEPANNKKAPTKRPPRGAANRGELDASKTFQEAIEKEKRAETKLTDLLKSIEENKKLFATSHQNQEAEIDQFFEEYTRSLNQKILEITGKCKDSIKSKLKSEYQNYDAICAQAQDLLKKISKENTFSEILDETLAAHGQGNSDKSEAAKQYLADSFELKVGFTPLVKKYKLIKSVLPSINKLTTQPKPKFVTKESLFECSEKITGELEKSLSSLQKRLNHEVIKFSNPLKPFLESIEAFANAKSSILPPGFPQNEPLGPLAKAANVKEMIYKLQPDEIASIAENEIFSEIESTEMPYLTQSVSIHYDAIENDLISYEGIPHRISKKVWEYPTDIITLENMFTGKTQEVKLHSRWQEAQNLILAEDYIVTKVNEKKGFYTLLNLDNEKNNTKVLLQPVSFKHVLNERVKQELERLLKDHKTAVVKTLLINQKEIIVSCNELRSVKASQKAS